MLREARDRECNARAEAVGGINNNINNERKEMERDQDELGTAWDSLASAKVEVLRLAPRLMG